MAAIKGIKEKVHLPLYDSIFVGPGRQLRDIATSSVLKFFVNVQGKTKLETNMQSTALLPHWNTFEARALRVVVSDLPPRFSREVERCLTTSDRPSNGGGSATLTRCIETLAVLITGSVDAITVQQVNAARDQVNSFKQMIKKKKDDIYADWPGAIGILRIYGDAEKVTPILDLQGQLKQVRNDLLDVLNKSGVTLPKALQDFANKVKGLKDDGEEKNLRTQLKDVNLIINAVEQLVALVDGIDKEKFAALQKFFTAVEQFLQGLNSKAKALDDVKTCLLAVAEELVRHNEQPPPVTTADINRCLNDRLGDKRLIPLDDQLAGSSLRLLSKLIYNSVTSFIVGEKTMIQMPTWFFPSDAGPFSEDGGAVTHGFPAPEATFRFAEPVYIDTQQNFRVEIEIPEANALAELQRIYGPYFIWVALDGYMNRDVQ